MARGNQRDKAREAAQKKMASMKAGNSKTGAEMQRDKEKTLALMKEKQAKADEKKRLEAEAAQQAKKAAEEEKKRVAEEKKKKAEEERKAKLAADEKNKDQGVKDLPDQAAALKLDDSSTAAASPSEAQVES